eukprot:GHVH01007641.1.p1 GENE.GHVH01007641.1~~GHVH01007641.1.p1  ORF type:complete len:347 (+),score=54.25 GHVH01007641.1:70-1110(+)
MKISVATVALTHYLADAYLYSDQVNWGVACSDNDFRQQSPVTMAGKDVKTSGGGEFLLWSRITEFNLAPTVKIKMDSDETRLSLEYQVPGFKDAFIPGYSNEAVFELSVENALSVISWRHFNTSTEEDEFDRYILTEIHLKLGASENNFDTGVRGGAFLLRHQNVSGDLAIVEFPFFFGSEAPKVIDLILPTECPNGSQINSSFCGARTQHTSSVVGGIDGYGAAAMRSSGNRSLFEFLLVSESMTPGNFITYKGSITEPPCTKNVQWFVWSGTAIALEDWEGRAAIQNLFTNSFLPDGGNIRLAQVIRPNSVFAYIDGPADRELALPACIVQRITVLVATAILLH